MHPARRPTPNAASPAASRTGVSHPVAAVSAASSSGDPLSLGVLGDVLGYHLAQAAVITADTFARHVGDALGLRKVEYSLLLLLQANEALSPKRLGQVLALSAPNLTSMLDRLQARGLIRRERSTSDGRSHNVVLTDAGRRLADDGAAAARPMEDELSGRLSPVERLMLIELLRKVAGR